MKSTAHTKQLPDLRHWILGGVLILIAAFLCVALVYVNTHATSPCVAPDSGTPCSPTTQVTVGNATPSVDSVRINEVSDLSTSNVSSVAITPGTTATVYINGTVSDGNGYGDIHDVQAMFYRTTATCAGLGDLNGNNCYHTASFCNITGTPAGNSENYSCPIPLEYYADATDSGFYSATNWTAKVMVKDLTDPAAGSSSFATSTTEVAAQGALSFPNTIDFGSLAASQKTTTSNNVTTAISQAGNVREDMTVSGTDLTCLLAGSIPVGHLNWVTGTNESYDGAYVTALSGTTSNQFLDIGLQTSDSTVPSKDVYWNIFVPSDALGVCSGTITMTSVAH